MLVLSCSSTPKNPEPKRPTSAEAGKYAEFGNTFFNESRYTQAEEMYSMALELYLRIDDRIGTVNAYNSLAKVSLSLGKPREALKRLQASRAIIETLSSDSSGYAKAAAETFNNLGEVEYALGNYRKALDYFDESLELIREDSDSAVYAVLLHNRGTSLFSLGQINQAAKEIRSALEINLRRDKLYETASNYYMLSLIAHKTGNAGEAKENVKKALRYDRETENSNGIAQDLFLLGRIEHSEGNDEEALDYLHRAEQIFESLKLAQSLENVVEYRRRMEQN